MLGSAVYPNWPRMGCTPLYKEFMADTAVAVPAIDFGPATMITGGMLSEADQGVLVAQSDRVGNLNARRRELEKQAVDRRRQLIDLRADVILGAHQARDSANKPLYTNAEQREAAVVIGLRDASAYQSIEEQRRRVQEECDRVAVEYSVAKDRLNIMLAAAGVAQPIIESNYDTVFAVL